MSKRILFVDDEGDSVEPYFEKLRDRGLEPELAVDGNDAIKRLQKNKYDLLVLDIMLQSENTIGKEPRRAGATLLEMIRQNKIANAKTAPDVPAVILTAVTDEKLLSEIKRWNVSHIFRKPFAFADATETLLKLIHSDKAEQK